MNTLILSVLLGQLPQAPPIKEPEAIHAPKVEPTYNDMATAAYAAKKPFVVFLNCSAREVPGCVSHQVMGGFGGLAEPGIVVSRPYKDWGKWVDTLKPEATDAEIRAVLQPAARQRNAVQAGAVGRSC